MGLGSDAIGELVTGTSYKNLVCPFGKYNVRLQGKRNSNGLIGALRAICAQPYVKTASSNRNPSFEWKDKSYTSWSSGSGVTLTEDRCPSGRAAVGAYGYIGRPQRTGLQRISLRCATLSLTASGSGYETRIGSASTGVTVEGTWPRGARYPSSGNFNCLQGMATEMAVFTSSNDTAIMRVDFTCRDPSASSQATIAR